MEARGFAEEVLRHAPEGEDGLVSGSGSREETIEPAADCPSARKIVDSSPRFLSPLWYLQSLSWGILISMRRAASLASFFNRV